MGALIIIGLFLVAIVFISDGLNETKTMHDVDKMIDENEKWTKEYFKKEYGKDLIK